MSYTLFLLMDSSHEREDLLKHIAQLLEQTGPESFCLDRSPDVFFSVEYLAEGEDRSLCLEIPFGGEEATLREVLDFLAHVEKKWQIQVLDPQIGGTLKSGEAGRIIDRWKSLNLQALESYADGHHFLRNVELREGRKVMVEAIRFAEETWQNHCSVALAYSRVGHAADARKLFERALFLDPENPEVLYALGVTCFNLRDYSKCREYLNSALAVQPDLAAAADLLKDCELKLRAGS